MTPHRRTPWFQAKFFFGRECTEMSFGIHLSGKKKSVPQRPPGRLVPIPPKPFCSITMHTLRVQDKDRRRYDSKHQMVSYAPGDVSSEKSLSLRKLQEGILGANQP
ncbi:hypothetical protein TNCV_216601 [Trichonephila clavipes]|nr:hypothetical protein TNCV_216601 [Trichonephila clavipes]